MHACFLLNRFMIGHDGMSAYQRLRKKPFDKPIVELGEAIYYKKPKNTIGPNLHKADSHWGIGIMLGVRAISGEFWVGTSEGVLKIRTIRRVPIDKRWDTNLLSFAFKIVA